MVSCFCIGCYVIPISAQLNLFVNYKGNYLFRLLNNNFKIFKSFRTILGYRFNIFLDVTMTIVILKAIHGHFNRVS